MIIYTCPKCSGDIYHHSCWNSIPPYDIYKCYNPKCDWTYKEVIKLPKPDKDWILYEAISNVMRKR